MPIDIEALFLSHEFFIHYHKPSLILQAFLNGDNLNLEINGKQKR